MSGRLLLLGLASGLGWASLAFGFPATGSRPDVLRFLVTIGGLFALLPFAVRAVRRQPRGALVALLSLGAAFRLIALGAGTPLERPWSAIGRDLAGEVTYRRFLLYDDDVWRYLWDGHVGAADHSPYARSPAEWLEAADGDDPAAGALLADLAWWERLDLVRYPRYGTVYPPGAQLLFRLGHGVAPGSVFAWKALLALVDCATCLLLVRLLRHLGRPPEEVVLYAWNPLVIKEISASGHLDGAFVFLLVLGVERLVSGARWAGPAGLVAASAVKLASLPLLPLALRRAGRPGLAVVSLALALGWGLRDELGRLAVHLAAFAADWEFNAGPWAAFRALARGFGAAEPEAWARAVTVALFGSLVVLVSALSDPRDDRAVVRAVFLLLAGAAVLGPAVMPWYLLWALPFAVALGFQSWVLLGALAFGSYLVYCDGLEPWGWIVFEWGLFAVAAVAEAAFRRARRSTVSA